MRTVYNSIRSALGNSAFSLQTVGGGELFITQEKQASVSLKPVGVCNGAHCTENLLKEWSCVQSGLLSRAGSFPQRDTG